MKGLGSRVTKALCVGSRLVCNDNSGAKILQIIGVIGTKARHGRVPKAGVSDVVICAVKKGNPSMKKKIVRVCIVRQRKEYRRPNGMRIRFEDNAAVLVDEDGLPVGTEIKGVIAREVAERFPKVAAIAAAVV
jgi:large subunit ribosomal protein L14